MATKKVIYFQAGSIPTSDELADIAKLNVAAEPQYVINVSNKVTPSGLSGIEQCDFVSGDVPTAYAAKPVIDPDSIPVQNLPATSTVVENAEVIASVSVNSGGTAADKKVTFTVAAGAITLIKIEDV